MNLIIDIGEIARLSELNWDRNMDFRTFLKCSSRWADGKELDALVHEILAEVTSGIDCTTCGNCCREMGVAVDADDIERLARRVGISPEEFEERHVAVDNDYGEKFMPETPCPFLGGNLCTVYEDRPTVCREFPHLHKEHFRSRLFGVVDNSAMCPIVFNVYEELKRRTNWRPKC
jgi:Fe-S-cluster containining protein